jgi:hypothetical protein
MWQTQCPLPCTIYTAHWLPLTHAVPEVHSRFRICVHVQNVRPAPANSTVDLQVAMTVFQRAAGAALAERHMRNARIAAEESAKWSAIRDQEVMEGLLRIQETETTAFKAVKKILRQNLPSTGLPTNKRGRGEENAAPSAKRPSLGEGNDGAGPSCSN